MPSIRRRETADNGNKPVSSVRQAVGSYVPPQIAHGVGYPPLNRSDARNGCSRFSPDCAEPGKAPKRARTWAPRRFACGVLFGSETPVLVEGSLARVQNRRSEERVGRLQM